MVAGAAVAHVVDGTHFYNTLEPRIALVYSIATHAYMMLFDPVVPYVNNIIFEQL